MKTKNPVAKHARHYNKSAVHVDRKKKLKRGDQKHKSRYTKGHSVLFVMATFLILGVVFKR